MKKSLKSSLKKRSPDIYLQHKNQASYKFPKKNFLHLAEKRAGVKGLKDKIKKNFVNKDRITR